MPLRTVFGWQRPCYLLGEGYVPTFKQLMEETNWDAYGVGNYEKMRRLHGAFGLRGDGGGGQRQAPVARAESRAVRRQDRWPDGARYLAG